jgi:hypothetical protein
MPLWAVLLARVLLGERLTALAAVRVALALGGAAIVLWPSDGSAWNLSASTAEALALLGGFTFALNNVLLRREAHRPEGARALAMFAGGALVSLVAALWLAGAGTVAWPPAPAPGWVVGVLALAGVFLAALTRRHGPGLGPGDGPRSGPAVDPARWRHGTQGIAQTAPQGDRGHGRAIGGEHPPAGQRPTH